MKFYSFKDNTDSLLVSIEDRMLRCDLYQRYLDILYIRRFSHQRVIRSHPLKEVVECDLEPLLQATSRLIAELTVSPYQVVNVYRHDRNDRFILLEGSKGQRLELDKELNGVRDRSQRWTGNMYKSKPHNYLMKAAVGEYLRIIKEQKRAFEQALHLLQMKGGSV